MAKRRKSQEKPKGKPNRLAGEKSPYLLQHAFNPVDWFPWGPEAFETAKRENKPLLLSIGYSTCHWCHVMEAESFDDAEVANALSETFVCIKVDREERPDIDSVYMNACQMITGGGGWPLTILMTPDQKPFFAATYLPKHSRQGLIGLLDLAARVRHLWTEKNAEMLESAKQITDVLSRPPKTDHAEPTRDLLDLAFDQLSQNFDETYAGFGEAMKFPTPHNLTFLLRYWKRTGNSKALEMAERTLDAMRRGGIFDHVGLGFHRYATDRKWLVPHFEKMLYDQAMLTIAYTEAFLATNREIYAETVREIFEYVSRELTSDGGGFLSAQDADSEGEEGKFYLWTRDELEHLLSGNQFQLAVNVFNVREEGNFVDPHVGQTNGQNILHQTRPLDRIAAELKISEPILRKHLEEIRSRLFVAREKRVHPDTDDKILTDWNGLMIAALAMAGRAMDEPEFTHTARRAFEFVQTGLRDKSGKLLHRYRQGQASVPAMLGDYAFLAWAAIELYETTLDAPHLKAAIELTDTMVAEFHDQTGGGFFMTASAAGDLIVRPKDYYDSAIPSCNSIAALNLLRLARLTANPHYERLAAETLRSITTAIRKAPSGYTQMLAAVDFAVGPSFEVVVVGAENAGDTTNFVRALHTHFLPAVVYLLRPTQTPTPQIVHLADFLKNYATQDHRAAAYVCQNFTCRQPVGSAEAMLEQLIK